MAPFQSSAMGVLGINDWDGELIYISRNQSKYSDDNLIIRKVVDMIRPWWTTVGLAIGMSLSLVGCGGNSGSNTPPVTTYVLTVNSTNPSSGVAITVNPADSNGAASGTTSFTRTYDSGASVTLTAPSTSGSNTFSSWTGCTSVSAATCTVTLNANTSVTANYATPAPTTYMLNVDSTDPSSGVSIAASPADNNSKTGGTTGFSLIYNSGTAIILTAPSTSGTNTFSSWTGCTTTSGATCNVTLTANTTVTANYTASVTPPTTYVLTVSSTDPASGVTVTVSPADNNGAGNGATGFTRTYNSGTTVTLTAPAISNGNAFSSWTGCTSASSTICTLTLAANTTVTANYAVPVSTTYVLTVNSVGPSSGVAISVSPADNNSATNGSTSFTRTYNAGKVVTLQAPTTTGTDSFVNWTGCTSALNETCSVTLSANTTVTANYNGPHVTSVTVTPNPATVTIGSNRQFSATVNGTGLSGNAVTWSLAAPAGNTDSPGTITSSGLYTSPYPAPPTVTVTATSTQDTSISGSVTVTLAAPATAAGPLLSVDAGNQTHAISPYIYGMNAYLLDSTTASNANITVARWGGDDTSRYNYQNNIANSANDYFFENFSGSSGMLGGGLFNSFVTTTNNLGIASLGTAPVIGWVSNSTVKACSFPESAYPNQKQFNSDNCGNGVDANGTSLEGNNTIAAITSIAEAPPTAPGAGNATTSWADATWAGGWVHCLLTSGTDCASTGGKDVTIWDLDNEPEYWSDVHRDVHPNPMTYDEITNGGIGTALAIKTADPAALVSGPIISGWYQYFYSQLDVTNGYATGPCYDPWGNPTDRQAHGGVPLIEYYLKQMAAASSTYGVRLLDYVDVHAYVAANYNGVTVGLTTAGDTGEQQARMNSTRVFWDPTYTDPDLPQPNYTTDPNYTSSCSVPDVAPEIIPRMQSWVANDYPGTKTSIDEYNFGGNESINGAVTQADILGIFGEYGLDMAALWPTTNDTAQVPGTMAFEIYRNYDGNKSTFGNTALSSASANQGTLSVYGAIRSSDNAITIVVINKTYGALTSILSLANYPETTAATAESFLYSNANPSSILAQPGVTVTPPAAASTTSTITATFPAQSITLLVVPAI
jgi:Glycoside hydrolase family 44/Divergent InlB B-repeat domain